MTADELKATCLECEGEGVCYDRANSASFDCAHCDGSGECGCDECVNTASENAYSDMREGEPPLSADERHRLAWQQKQRLR